jgi:N-carbamoylputrescine amidase
MSETFDVRTDFGARSGSPARMEPGTRSLLRLAAIQTRWHADRSEHEATLEAGVATAAALGAQIACLQELTLSPYFATKPDHVGSDEFAELIPDGPTTRFAHRLAARHQIIVHASLYERTESESSYNTAIAVTPNGELLARTRKIHIPQFPGYHEDRYFALGDSEMPVIDAAGARFGYPTCWDQWFPELARAYSLGGAEVLVYPTAIGSEPQMPDFDTKSLWQQMICANGLANATFMVAVTRIGTEDGCTFYGSSFISDPYGRVLVQASRDRDTVLVADLDLDQRRDWLGFGLLDTRRPSQYSALTR